MRQRIAIHEHRLKDPSLKALPALVTRTTLFFAYIQYACVHAFTLLFMHPTKSFVALNDPRPDGLWQHSYIEHVAYRNRVRFASLSGFGVLVTAAIATFVIVVTVFPNQGISPVYASSLVVNSGNDVDDGTCDFTHCSLREAINSANSEVGAGTITFSNTPLTISPTSALPTLTDNQTTIRGGGTVIIDGTNAGLDTDGLDIAADNVTIKGLDFTHFGNAGISISSLSHTITIGGSTTTEANAIYNNTSSGIIVNGGSGHVIGANFIGQERDGTLATNENGIEVVAGSSIHIGTTTGTNYIADGLIIQSGASEVTVVGNVVGVTSSGQYGGLTAAGLTANGTTLTIGGTGTGESNYFVGSASDGIDVANAASDVSIVGNYIGVNTDGVTLIGNSDQGINVEGADSVTISSNTIVDSGLNGISIDASTGTNEVSDNYIGVLSTDSTSGGNIAGGILISSASDTTIADNVIGNNGNSGLTVGGTDVEVTGNYIGVDAQGTDIGNAQAGVSLSGAVVGSVIGGSEVNRNYIAGNGTSGVNVESNVTGVPEISYNYIGMADGNTALPNGQAGVYLAAPVAVSHNLISGNTQLGIEVASSGNTITSNIIGLNSTGDTAVPNADGGISVNSGVSNNTIGAVGEPNIVAGNTTDQLAIAGDQTTVIGNYVGCNLLCTQAVDMGSSGILLEGATNTTVNGNYVGGVGTAAIEISSASSGNEFTGNFIGVGTDNSDISGNATYGISNTDSNSQTIGTTADGNEIAYFSTGIFLSNSQQVSIRGNFVHDNDTQIDFTDGSNSGVTSPIISGVTSTEVSGTSTDTGFVDVYQDNVYMDSTSSDGAWSLSGSFDPDALITATITDEDGNTSLADTFSGDVVAPTSAASPVGGNYNGTQYVTLTATDNTDSAPRIFYTTTGAVPTISSTLYTSELSITEDTVLKFFAVDVSGNEESVNTETYTIQQYQSGVFGTSSVGIVHGSTVVHPDCVTCTLRTSDTTPTFIGQVKQSLIDYVVRLVVLAVSANEGMPLEEVFSKEKKISENPNDATKGMWKITVPSVKALDLGEYVVKLGLLDQHGEVVKAPTKRLSLAVTPPAPVIVAPQDSVYTNTPSFVGNSSNGTTVIARVFQNNTEIAHCQTTTVDSSTGTGSYACSLPFDLEAGSYNAEVFTQSGDSISAPSLVRFTVSRPTPASENVPFSLVPGQASITGQFLTTDNTPVFVGLAPNDTEILLVIDGAQVFSGELTNATSGVGHWRATTSYLGEGTHTAYAVVRIDGIEQSRTDIFTFNIVAPTVVPLITAPVEGGLVAFQHQFTLTVLGHSNDSVTLTLTGSSTITVSSRFSDDSSGTGQALFTFTNGLPVATWTASAVATDSTGKPSSPSTKIHFRSYIPSASVTTNTNSNSNTNADSNVNEQVNTNVEVNTNIEVNVNNDNTNSTVNENVNTNNLNENTNGAANTNANTNSGEPVVTPSDRTPLPPTTPVFTLPSGIEHFPNITKIPSAFTSDEEHAVSIVLNSYLKEQLQVIPAETEGNAVYVVNDKNANNQTVLTTAKSIGLQGSDIITGTMNSVLRLLGQNQLTQTDAVLIFRGTTIPYATVKLSIFSDPIVKIAQADADGHWTMTVPADSLPSGEHTAYVQTSYGTATSDEVQIARFVVVQKEKLSNTSWLFIINLGVILVVLLAAIFLQLRKRTQLLQAQTTTLPGSSPWKSGSVSVPPTNQKNINKPKGPDDLGDIMGI